MGLLDRAAETPLFTGGCELVLIKEVGGSCVDSSVGVCVREREKERELVHIR